MRVDRERRIDKCDAMASPRDGVAGGKGARVEKIRRKLPTSVEKRRKRRMRKAEKGKTGG